MNSMAWQYNTPKTHLLLIVALTIMTRAAYLCTPAGRIGDADEAVFGMMAQKIEALEEFPIYCWGAHYASTAVSYIAAVIFNFSGSGFVQLRLAMTPFALLSPVLFYFACRRILTPGASLAATIFTICCPFFVLRYTLGAYGGYGETYVGVPLIILLAWKVLESRDSGGGKSWMFTLGLASGFFTYVLFLVLPAVFAFAGPCVFLAKRQRLGSIMAFLAGGVSGALPFIAYNIMQQGGTFIRATGRSLAVGRDSMDLPLLRLAQQVCSDKVAYLADWLSEAPNMLGQYVLPEFVGNLGLEIGGLCLVIALLWFASLAFSKSRLEHETGIFCRQQVLFLVLLILFQWVANLNRPRHLMPLLLVIPIALLVIAHVYHRFERATIGLVVLLSAFQLIGWTTKVQDAFFDPYSVVDSMNQKGVRAFYGSYTTTYPIIFASKGTLIGSPMLLPRDRILSDRRPDYTAQVRNSPAPAFVFANDERELQVEFEDFLARNLIRAETIHTREATIFWNLSKSIAPVVESPMKVIFVVPSEPRS